MDDNIWRHIRMHWRENHSAVGKLILSQAVEELLSCMSVFQRAQCLRQCKNRSRKFIWHIVKSIRGSIIFPNNFKIHVWKWLRAFVYILWPYCGVFLEFKKEKAHIYFSLFLDPCYYRMKMFKYFKNCVERIKILQFNWSLITLVIYTG